MMVVNIDDRQKGRQTGRLRGDSDDKVRVTKISGPKFDPQWPHKSWTRRHASVIPVLGRLRHTDVVPSLAGHTCTAFMNTCIHIYYTKKDSDSQLPEPHSVSINTCS